MSSRFPAAGADAPIAISQLLKVDQIASLLCVDRFTVYRWIKNHRHRPLPHLKIGRQIRFCAATVDGWLDEQRVGPQVFADAASRDAPARRGRPRKTDQRSRERLLPDERRKNGGQS